MDSSPRGVRFQNYPSDGDNVDGEVPRNQTPVSIARSVANSNSSMLPPSPRPRTTVPSSHQQQPTSASPTNYFHQQETPIDYGVPSLVEEGGFPFETPAPTMSGYTWGQVYYPNGGQYFTGYEQGQPPQQPQERSPTERNNAARVRPGIARMPSNTYSPIRYPETGGHYQHRESSTLTSLKPLFLRRGTSLRNPSTQRNSGNFRPTRGYMAKQPSDPDDDYLQHSNGTQFRRDTEIESEDGSVGDEFREYDNEFDVDHEIPTAGIDLTPSTEDLQNPEYIERIEWQNRLSQVLSGDVVTSEKKRIAEPSGPEDQKASRYELWLGIRAKAYGRSLADQRRILVEGRAYMDRVIEDVLSFSIRTHDEGAGDGRTAEQQVDDILARWERCEALYSSRAALMEDKPHCADGSEFEVTLSALIAWSNVTKNVHTSLQILRAWTGQDDLDLTRRGVQGSNSDTLNINDESSFIERILKENQIEQTFSKAILSTLNKQVYKAKETVEANHIIFDRMRLPSFLGDVQLIVNFPTKLIEEALKIRLAYARKLRDPSLIVIDQLIDDFALCLKVAVGIKKEYLMVTKPTEGWNLISWMDDSFDAVLLDALRFYFRLLQKKLDNRTEKVYFKDAEILEDQWDFLTLDIAKYIEGGDAVVAEQFTYLGLFTLLIV